MDRVLGQARLPTSLWDMDATAFVKSSGSKGLDDHNKKARGPIDISAAGLCLNAHDTQCPLPAPEAWPAGSVPARDSPPALSYEAVVFGLLAGSAACTVGIRLAMPFSRRLPDLLEAIVVDVLRRLLRIRLFHKRNHGSRSFGQQMKRSGVCPSAVWKSAWRQAERAVAHACAPSLSGDACPGIVAQPPASTNCRFL